MLLGDRTDVAIMPVRRDLWAHRARCSRSCAGSGVGFVIGQAGGALLPADGSWADFARALECPLFVMR